ncbi:hypothetical protein HY478_03060 [Candidatus Uhrbacteria bacterium]|nr:hypothetical protein [Candidatus Uhrbacteria bacterium]
MQINDTIARLLSLYQLPAIFISSFFFGESVILTAAFLSSQGLWSIFNVFWISLAGTLVSDVLWFYFGYRILGLFECWEVHCRQSEKMLPALERITGRRPFLSLC